MVDALVMEWAMVQSTTPFVVDTRVYDNSVTKVVQWRRLNPIRDIHSFVMIETCEPASTNIRIGVQSSTLFRIRTIAVPSTTFAAQREVPTN